MNNGTLYRHSIILSNEYTNISVLTCTLAFGFKIFLLQVFLLLLIMLELLWLLFIIIIIFYLKVKKGIFSKKLKTCTFYRQLLPYNDDDDDDDK